MNSPSRPMARRVVRRLKQRALRVQPPTHSAGLPGEPAVMGVATADAVVTTMDATTMDATTAAAALGRDAAGVNADFVAGARARRTRLEAPRSCQRILVVGTGEVARRLASELKRHFPADFTLIGFVSDGADDALERSLDFDKGESGDGPIVGTREELSILVRRHRIDRVMFSNCVDWQLENTGFVRRSPQDRRAGAGEAENCNREKRERRREVGDLYEWASSAAFFAPDARRARVYETGKRAFDVAFSLLALALVAPLAMVVLPLVKLTSPGPVFYGQERVGRGGAAFTIWKIRSMTVDAETRSGPMLSPHGDKRSTAVGKVLRATKIDEMPQFWNVLRGEMSIVGPRPERPHFVDPFSSHIYSYALRHSVRPGLTGLAQIKGDHLTHVYIKLHYDLIYVCHRTLGLDLMLLARTPGAVLKILLRRS